MSETKTASEAELGDMHKRVTRVLNKALETMEAQQEAHQKALDAPQHVYLDEEENEGYTLEAPVYVEPSPAFLKVVTGFLKDNDVTVQPDEDGMNDLAENLRARREKRPIAVGDIPHGD